MHAVADSLPVPNRNSVSRQLMRVPTGPMRQHLPEPPRQPEQLRNLRHRRTSLPLPSRNPLIADHSKCGASSVCYQGRCYTPPPVAPIQNGGFDNTTTNGADTDAPPWQVTSAEGGAQVDFTSDAGAASPPNAA